MKTILLIGAHSNIGQFLVGKLNENHSVITAGRSNSDVIIDLIHPETIDFGSRQFDLVIHCAAHFGGSTIEEASEAATINTLSSITLLQKSIAANAKQFIYLSSIFTDVEYNSIWHNAYSISKKHAEEWLQFLTRSNPIDLLILKPTMTYGDDLSFSKHQKMPYFFIDQAHQGKDINIHGNGMAIRNYLHVNDLVDVICKCIEKNISGTYECMHPDQITIREMAEIATQLTNKTASIHVDPSKSNPESIKTQNDDGLYLKIDKTEFISFAEGMKRIYETNYLNGHDKNIC